MKSLKIFFLAALVALAGVFTACTEDSDWNAGPIEKGMKVYFSNENASSVKVDNTMSSIDLVVMRTETEGVMEVSVASTIDPEYASLFTVDQTLLFEDGAAEGVVKIAFDYSKLTGGKTYEVAVNIVDETLHSNYANPSQTISIVVPEPYVLLGEGLYRDDLVNNIFDIGDCPEYKVEVYENLNNPGFIYMKNPYGAGYPIKASNFHAFANDVYFAIDARDPEAVVIPEQPLGLSVDSYGDFWVRMYGNNVGTYKDGIITFGAKTMEQALTNYKDGGFDYFWGCENGKFRLVMPGVEVTDYAMEVAYNGMTVAADNKTTEAVFKGTYGADVASFKYVFFTDDVTAFADQIAAGVADGTYEAAGEVEVEAGLDEEMRVFTFTDGGKLEAPGSYTVAVIPCNADGELQTAEVAAASFYYAGVGAQDVPAATVKAKLFPVSELYNEATVAQYPDHTSIAPLALGENAVSARYGLVTGLTLNGDLEGQDGYECLDYVCSALAKTRDEFLSGKLDDEDLADLLNPNYGWSTIFYNLPSSFPVAFFIEVANLAGETAIYVTGGTTAADPSAASAVPATGSGVLKPHFEVAGDKLTHIVL